MVKSIFYSKKLFTFSYCGAKNVEELLDDNFSYFSTDDILKYNIFSKHQIAGLISSLLEKNIINLDSDDSYYLNIDFNDELYNYLVEKGL